MTVLVVTGGSGKGAADTAQRDKARAQELARHLDDLVVLEADEAWWAPLEARQTEISWRRDRSDPMFDLRRPGTVVLLLDADLDQVKVLHPLARKIGVPLLWWHEDPPSDVVVQEVRQSIAGMLTTGTDRPAVPGWLWSVGAGIDLHGVAAIETFPARPPLRLLAWLPTGTPDLDGVLRALAFAAGPQRQRAPHHRARRPRFDPWSTSSDRSRDPEPGAHPLRQRRARGRPREPRRHARGDARTGRRRRSGRHVRPRAAPGDGSRAPGALVVGSSSPSSSGRHRCPCGSPPATSADWPRR